MSDSGVSVMSSETLGNGSVPGLSLSEISESLTAAESESPPDTPRCPESDHYEEPTAIEIERDLDALTYSGSTINELEVQLSHAKQAYQKKLMESKRMVENLRRRLNTHIKKSEPFIEIWRKARRVQEESNEAAKRFDKANSQHAASKEMIRMAESQLAGRATEGVEPGSPSPLDLAWQEMLNHATNKVVETERERRISELEHRTMLQKVQKVMEDYRATERRLRTHIIKSKPYYEERFRANQRLEKLKQHMTELEHKINESKQTYTNTLRKLELLNTEIHHHRRVRSQTIPCRGTGETPQVSSSTGSSPKLTHRDLGDSLDSVQVPEGYNGSTGSLPSIGTSSVSGSSPTPPSSYSPEPSEQLKMANEENSATSYSISESYGEAHRHTENRSETSMITNGRWRVIQSDSHVAQPSPEKVTAGELVSRCLATAVKRVSS